MPATKARSVPVRTRALVVTDNPFVCSQLCEAEARLQKCRAPTRRSDVISLLECDHANARYELDGWDLAFGRGMPSLRMRP